MLFGPMKLPGSLYCVILSILQWNQWEIVDLGYIGKLSRRPSGCHILLCIVRLERLAVLSAARKRKSGVVYYAWFEEAWLIKLRTFLKGRLKYMWFCFADSVFYCYFIVIASVLYKVWKVTPRVGVDLTGQRCSSRVWFNRFLYIEKSVFFTVL